MSDEFPSELWGKFTSRLPNILLSTEYAPGPRTPSAKLTTIAAIKWNRSTLSLVQRHQNSRHPANAAAYGVKIPNTRQTAATNEPVTRPIDCGTPYGDPSTRNMAVTVTRMAMSPIPGK